MTNFSRIHSTLFISSLFVMIFLTGPGLLLRAQGQEPADESAAGAEEIDFSGQEEKDDLSSLKSDLGVEVAPLEEDLSDKYFTGQKEKDKEKDQEGSESFKKDRGLLDLKQKPGGEGEASIGPLSTNGPGVVNKEEGEVPGLSIEAGFDVGKEEKDLLDVAKLIENKIPEKEWNEMATTAKLDRYTVVDGDYLWKISKKLFGSGFYYSKVWSLNPYITNPHEIKPAMVLVFDTGDADTMPNIQVGEFVPVGEGKEGEKGKDAVEFSSFGDETEPSWMKDKKRLMDAGTYVQYATDRTYEDLNKISQINLNREYEKYSPPVADILPGMPGDEYDANGFDKTSKVVFNFKEGFYLNTFVTTNLVQDFGEVDAAIPEKIFLARFDTIYVRFNPSLAVAPGDKFSIYSAAGKSSHPESDRSGYKYVITGHLQTMRKISDLWECKVFDNSGLIQRKDRITVYTPKIEQIIKTFNSRNIEAMIIDSYDNMKNKFSYGDVVFLDRGRADGVEMGNVFEVYSFWDKGTGRKITPDPTYKIGELTVITLTDNFATVLVTNSSDEIDLGSLALSKTMESAALASRVGAKSSVKDIQGKENKALDELDVELNLEDINEDLLKKADKIELAEDELEELEKQEREKSIIQKGEKDLKELEKLEKEIESAEAQLNAAKVDEDKNLEQQDLNNIEKRGQAHAKDMFDALNEIEREEGKKFLDEDLNSKENPYGLTEFDLEEIDELLNTTPK